MPILQSVASNVESALAFSLSVKVVDILGQLRGSAAVAGSYQGDRDARDGVLVFCLGILFLSMGSTFLTSGEGVPSKFRATGASTLSGHGHGALRQKGSGAQQPHPQLWRKLWHSTVVLASSPLPSAITRGLKDISNHVMVLSLSRLAMQQVRLSKFSVDPNMPFDVATFQYVQRIIEITFIGILVSSCLTTLLPALQAIAESKMMKGGGGGGGAAAAATAASPSPSDSLVQRQLNSLIVNMQRTFADTITSAIPDVQTRKMVVLLGLCILPSISSLVTGQGDSAEVLSTKRVGEFFLMFQRRREEKVADRWRETSSMLAKIWVAGLSMAWINTALSFIISNESVEGLMQTWISVVSTICLAVLTRALHPMFPGLEVFQGYIEWSVANSALSYIGMSVKRGSPNGTGATRFIVVGCTGAAFYAVDVLLRDTVRKERLGELKRTHHKAHGGVSAPKMSATLETLQSVTIIMFTNSMVSYSMELISPSQRAGIPSARSLNSIGAEVATVVVGLIVAKSLVQIVNSASSKV